MSLKIFLGELPAAPDERRILRDRGLDLRARLAGNYTTGSACLLLNYRPDGSETPIDLLLLQAEALLVGVIETYDAALDILPDGRWLARDGREVGNRAGRTPRQRLQHHRELTLAAMTRAADTLPGLVPDSAYFARTVAALIIAPRTHPDTRATLDIGDHRRQIKLMGLDELAPLAAMLNTGVDLGEVTQLAICADLFGGRLWLDGQQTLFEPAASRFRLRLLHEGEHDNMWPLLEGETLIGRRRTPIGHEYRIILSGDELMSNDHARITCAADGRVLLRDTSTNGTWLATPDGEQRLHRTQRLIKPGMVLRMGNTRLQLEEVGVKG